MLQLKPIIKAVALAAGKKDVRHYLNGVCIDAAEEGVVRIIGTDGQRLHMVSIKRDDWPSELDLTYIDESDRKQIIISNDGIKTLCSGSARSHIESAVWDGVLGSFKVEGRYPQYERLLAEPKSGTDMPIAPVNANYLATAAKAIESYSKSVGLKFNGARIHVGSINGNSMKISSEDGKFVTLLGLLKL